MEAFSGWEYPEVESLRRGVPDELRQRFDKHATATSFLVFATSSIVCNSFQDVLTPGARESP